MAHVMIFEHANFHGAHKHVFTREPNLNAGDDNFFNDKVSSFVILSGLWVFFTDSQFQNPYAGGTQFGPAIDGSRVEALGIKNDDMSSLFPSSNLVARRPNTYGVVAKLQGETINSKDSSRLDILRWLFR